MSAEPPADRRVPLDPDVDLHDARNAAELRPREWNLLLAVAAGGVLGAEGRYGLDVLLPHAAGVFPSATLLINVSGCLLIGVLMAVLGAVRAPRLARPFLGVGVLGGYTTFSTFAVDVDQLLHAGRVIVALGYLLATATLCMLAVVTGWIGTRRVLGRPTERSEVRP